MTVRQNKETMQPAISPVRVPKWTVASPPARAVDTTKVVESDSFEFSDGQYREPKSSWGDLVRSALTLGAAGAGAIYAGHLAAQEQVVEVLNTQPVVDSVQVTEIAPSATDPLISQARGPHLALVDPQVEPNGYLLLSLGGTNSIPSDFLSFDRQAAQNGYSVLALDYPNTVITTTCRTSPQPDACTLFREEIVAGEQVSDLVEVDRNNSIEHRLESLLRYQADRDPERFGAFITENGPAWEKIVVVGHSQGSGHAGFLAKKHPMQAAILLAGPQDMTAAGPASWMSAPGATPSDRFLSFLHRDDFFDSSSQLDAVRVLRNDPQASPILVDHQAPDSPIIMSKAKVRDPHMSVIGSEFSDIWQSLLQQAAQ